MVQIHSAPAGSLVISRISAKLPKNVAFVRVCARSFIESSHISPVSISNRVITSGTTQDCWSQQYVESTQHYS